MLKKAKTGYESRVINLRIRAPIDNFELWVDGINCPTNVKPLERTHMCARFSFPLTAVNLKHGHKIYFFLKFKMDE